MGKTTSNAKPKYLLKYGSIGSIQNAYSITEASKLVAEMLKSGHTPITITKL